jgi:hypothetical protein
MDRDRIVSHAALIHHLQEYSRIVVVVAVVATTTQDEPSSNVSSSQMNLTWCDEQAHQLLVSCI